jgi:hypothetical protein
MKFEESTDPGWEDAANYFRGRDMMYGTSELRVRASVPPQIKYDATPHQLTTFAEIMENQDIMPGISQGTSRQGCSHIRLGSVKLQSKSSIPSGEPAAEPDSWPFLKAKPVEQVNLYPSQWRPANYHIHIGCQRRDDDGSCVGGRIDMQNVIFDVWSQGKASCLQILLPVNFFLISGTKLWDMIMCLCMCKSRTHLVNVLEFISHCNTDKTYCFILQVTVKWQSESNISDELC